MKRRFFLRQAGAFGLGAMLMPPGVFGSDRKHVDSWHIEQFTDKGLAHFSYAILVGKKVIIIDPGRNPKQYVAFAKDKGAEITGVIETHPHADFASSHLELHRKQGAKIYASSLTKADYPLVKFDEGSSIRLSENVSLRPLFTPGHAPDHIAIVLSVSGKDVAVFSGDALLIGDAGRPDLRDNHQDAASQRALLANQLYDTLHQKFGKLNDEVLVYPAHGAGSLCGKAIRDASSSTIGTEKTTNPAFQYPNRQAFVSALLSDLPFTPQYFAYDVSNNLKGFPDFDKSIAQVNLHTSNFNPPQQAIIIDTRQAKLYKTSHQAGSINLQNGTKFETWLGSTIAPHEKFYLVAENESALADVISKTAKIGYENLVQAAYIYDKKDGMQSDHFEEKGFSGNQEKYTIIDVRTEREFHEEPIFRQAINIPLQDLKGRLSEIPKDKPILVNCASGYRSAAGSSILKNNFESLEVFDFGASVDRYLPKGKEQSKH